MPGLIRLALAWLDAKGQVAWTLDVGLSDEVVLDLAQTKHQVEALLSELDH